MPHDLPPDDLPRVGDLFAGKYRIEKLLGMGGMGAVFGANHEMLSQRVAIKVLLAEIAANQEAVARFTNEARASAKIQNIHCARVVDVGTLPSGQAYMVMEYLEGCDLAQLLERNGPLPLTSAVDFVLQALEALAHAHALHLVHRDLKPANLFLARQQDGTDVVKVLDFGISKATNPGGTSPSLTSTKALLGSPLYMSPEQLRSSKSVDPRADIWALGIILFELLTGRTPYDGDNVGELFAAILEKDAPPVRTFRPDAPAGLEDAVRGCLQRDPNMRYQDVGQLANALAPFASPHGALSADHVRRSLATLQGGAPLPPPGVITAVARAPGQQTAAAWGDAGIPAKGGGAGKLIAVAVVLLAAAVGGVLLFMHHASDASVDAAAAGSSAPSSASNASPAPADSASASVPAASATAPAPSATADTPTQPAASTPVANASGARSPTPVAHTPPATPAPHNPGGKPAAHPAASPAPGGAYDPTKDRSAQ